MAHHRTGGVGLAVALCLLGAAFLLSFESVHAQHVDLVFANYWQKDGHCVNDGAGSFACGDLNTDMLRTTSVTAALLDGDSLADFAFSVEGGPNRVCFNDGSDSFVCTDVSTISRNSRDVVSADVNGDGVQDLIFANNGQLNEVCIGDGSGSFSCSDIGTEIKSSNGVAAADIDGDEDIDLVFAVTSKPHTVCINDGTGQFSCSDLSFNFGSAQRVAAADFNGDGHVDVAFAEFGVSNRVCFGNGTGAFACSNVSATADLSFSVAAADLDGDGSNDLSFGNVFSQSTICLNDGAGVFTCSMIDVGNGMTMGTAAADVDGDGDVDLVFAVRDMPNRLCVNDGTGQFSCVNVSSVFDASIAVMATPLLLQEADSDGDGVADDIDLCPGTVIPEGITSVRPNRWALVDDDHVFDTGVKGPARRGGPRNSEPPEEEDPGAYTTEDTGGCSCEQIGAKLGFSANESNFGCLTGTMETWIAQISGASKNGAVDDGAEAAPSAFALVGNYPNPFNPTTTIRFTIIEPGFARLSVYDVLGREVAVLADGTIESGVHEVTFDAAGLPSGVYLSRLTTSSGSTERIMMMMK